MDCQVNCEVTIEDVCFESVPEGILVSVRLEVQSGDPGIFREGWRSRVFPSPLTLETVVAICGGPSAFHWPMSEGPGKV